MSRVLRHELEAANSGATGCLFHVISAEKWSVKPAVANLFALLIGAVSTAFSVPRACTHAQTHKHTLLLV